MKNGLKKCLLFVMAVVLLSGCLYTSAPVEAAYDYGVTGDVNGDGAVTTTDYLLVKFVFNGRTVSADVKENADVNNDGRITTNDYFIIKQIFSGIPVQVLPKPLASQPAVNDDGVAFNVTLNRTFTDNMVIQRNKYINVYGTGSRVGGVVYVKLGNEVRYGVVDNSGNWSVTLNGRSANTKGQSMKVYTKAQGENGGIRIDNILIGDVWIIAGQSNAQLSLNSTIINNSSFVNTISESDNIRLYTQWFWDCSNYFGDFAVSNKKYVAITDEPQTNPAPGTKWLVGNRNNALDFSAVGYYFAKMVADNSDVPLGIIQCVAGGSALCDFMPPDQYVASKHNNGLSQFNANDIYNCLIHPFSKTEIAGMIFYQGEGNESSHSVYAENLTDFVGMMRNIYGENMPFYNVQLPSHNDIYNSWPGLADVRFEQFDALNTIDNYYLVCTMDKAISSYDTDWAHPTNKKYIGDRLAYLALSNIYDYKNYNINYYGSPRFVKAEVEGQYAYLYFANYGDGLKASSDGRVYGFTNYSNGAALTATIESANCVKIKIPSGLKTIAYGDKSVATLNSFNLRNSNNMSALAFRCTI